jgi:hypothetical protein
MSASVRSRFNNHSSTRRIGFPSMFVCAIAQTYQ